MGKCWEWCLPESPTHCFACLVDGSGRCILTKTAYNASRDYECHVIECKYIHVRPRYRSLWYWWIWVTIRLHSARNTCLCMSYGRRLHHWIFLPCTNKAPRNLISLLKRPLLTLVYNRKWRISIFITFNAIILSQPSSIIDLTRESQPGANSPAAQKHHTPSPCPSTSTSPALFAAHLRHVVVLYLNFQIPGLSLILSRHQGMPLITAAVGHACRGHGA